jgi:4-hydroxybenzoate polyprenyltransferase
VHHLRSAGFASDPFEFAWVAVALSVAVSLIYCGGMVDERLVDRRIDAQERPGRPIPSGRVKPTTAAALFTAMLAAGLAIAIALVWFARNHSPPPAPAWCSSSA